MGPTTGFVLFLLITLAFLGAVILTGKAARRVAHLCCVGGAVLGLGITIYFAEQLGALYDLESAGWITPLHLVLAKITVCAYLLPVITGLRTMRDEVHKDTHGKVAHLVIGLTVLTAITGTAMVLMATQLS
ncbi:MAG TPA: hypothetical protein QF730_00485 [Planctomycetota bacterium]|nr:hypothetical protein [Planctomycetota bacterium]